MAGNEIEVTRFLFSNKGVCLRHIGKVKSIGYPASGGLGSYLPILKESDIDNVKTEGASKKADIYINGIGVSIKQAPTSPLFNRLQRANIIEVFSEAGFTGISEKVERLDREIERYQNGELTSRDVAWEDVFNEEDFSSLLELLMMRYNPNLGFSSHPASIILEAPSPLTSHRQINTYTFEEYFNQFKNKIVISMRRSWVGQKSESEHNRALGLVGKEGNEPWVFHGEGQRGGPRGWRAEWPKEKRMTAYYLIIYKNT